MSCLFRSLGRFLSMDENTMRTRICDFMRSDPVIFDNIKLSELIVHQPDIKLDQQQSLESYISQMMSPHTMGGAFEIWAFTKLFNKNARVLLIAGFTGHFNSTKFTEFISHVDNEWVQITWSGTHYEPV